MKALFMSGRLTEAEAELELQFRTVTCPVCDAQPGALCEYRLDPLDKLRPTVVSHAGRMRVWKEQP